MTKWVHSDVLDGGLNAIKSGATKMIVIKNYAAGDSYATVTGNALATAAMTSADFTIANGDNSTRTITSAAKSTAPATAAATGTGENHHIAFTDGAAKVLWVTDETSELPNNVGDTLNIPTLTYTSNQPS